MAGGVVANGVYYPTESGLNAPGGFIDRLTRAMDNRAQFNGTLAGLAPTLQAQGIPVAAPQGILGSMLGLLGLGGSQNQPTTPPPMPVARASQGSVSAGGASAPTSTSPTTTDAGTGGPTGMMGMFGNAIAGIESGGNYGALGPQTQSGDQALGKYQVMASNVPSWTKEVLGQEMTPQQFLASPQAQDAVFQGKFGQYLQKTGNPQDAASMWFTGRPLAQAANAADQLGTTGAGYVRKFMAALPGAGAGPSAVPSQASAYAPSGAAGDNPMPQATASGPQPSQAATLASSNTPGAAGSQQASTQASPGQVLAPLMQNPATRQIGAQLWQAAQQQGAGAGMPGSMTLPAGMTPEALATMISTPQTQAMGLAIWQKSLFPQITSIEPGRAIFRGTQYMGQAPSAPMAVKAGESVINPNAPGAPPIASVPPLLEHGPIGKDAYGNDIYGSINPQNGTATPFQAGQGNAGGTATGANGQLLTGDAFLGTLPPAFGNQVKAYADGRLKMPSGQSANSPMAQRLRAAVLQYDPTFDATNTDARFETRKDFASGKAAQSINSGNTAVQHAADLSDAAEALGNGQVPLLNKLRQAYGDQTGGNIPGKEFAGALNDFADEVVRFYRNSGGTEGDIAAVRAALDPSQSPDQLRAGIAQQARLIAAKTSAYQNQWHQGMGPLAGDYPILSTETQSALNRIGTRQPGVSSYPPQSAGGAGPSTSLPIAAPRPGGTAPQGPLTGAAATDAIAQARAAISNGKSRAAVIQRLQQLGVDPSGL